MGSRKAEERNEKIIRGLMKLPPNRRCINCNSLGPQYVCTNFWTFVCMSCSGIHREFTHRVKSVSMSKFTSQEVEALQKGGNQRAREIYLKDWDLQRQRLPNNSNVDKVREFIKNVYVDRRYAGGKTSDKPPKDTQGLGSRLDETRRASSYHSYSQSPPYDFQYEERRYGKFDAVLTRKPGSDRGNYIRKISSLVYSPGRLSEQMFGDRFADEGSGSRISSYSMSSGGDPFTSGTQSPNFEKDVGFNSPPVQPANFKRDVNGIPHPKRATSLGSMESFHSNSMSLKSYSSGGLTDVISEYEQAAGARLVKVSTFPQSLVPMNYGGLDLFEAPVVPEPVFAVPPLDLFQLPETSAAPVNMFQTSQASSAPSFNAYQPAQTSSPSSSDFFQISEQPSTATLDRDLQVLSIPKNEGWATFDTPPPATSISGTESISPAIVPGNEGSSVKFDQLPSSNPSMQWPTFQNSSANGPSPSSDPWPGNLHNVQAPAIARSTEVVPGTESLSSAIMHGKEGSSVTFGQFPSPNTSMQWPAFQNFSANGPSPSSGPWPGSLHKVQAPNIATITEEINDGNLRVASHDGPPSLTVPSHADFWPSYTPSEPPLMGEMHAHAIEHKSTNPFDFPCDSDLEQSNMFLGMSSLQAALPNTELPSPFIDDATQSWVTQNPVTPFVPAAAQGGLAYMSGKAPTAQLPNIPTQKPVAAVGGNPFA